MAVGKAQFPQALHCPSYVTICWDSDCKYFIVGKQSQRSNAISLHSEIAIVMYVSKNPHLNFVAPKAHLTRQIRCKTACDLTPNMPGIDSANIL